MHLIEAGQQHAQLTVVLLSGAGGFCPEWRLIQQQVAQFARVVTYDRAGYGWSDWGDGPRTPGKIVKELHALLKAADLPEPYVLVGHSLGGLYALAFADRYGAQTAGVVLVDASHPQMHLRPEINLRGELRELWQARLKALIGYQRLTAGPPGGHLAQLPPELLTAHRALHPRSVQTMFHEVNATWAEPLSFDLGDTPLIVLTRTPTKSALSPVWQDLQQDLTTYSADSRQIIAEQAKHELHLDAPELVIEAIRRLVRPGTGAGGNGLPA
jgi:pimeloyl-ACP methyl ester carboxylesterase